MTLQDAPGIGAIVWLSIWNTGENPLAQGKARPAVLISREYGHWWVMGFTSKAQFQNGQARIALPNPYRLGLRRNGYLWGDRLTRVCALDLGDVVGWCDPSLAEAVIAHAHLGVRDAHALRQTARTHHPHPPLAA